eukprot:UC4_evm1s754
MLQAIPFRFALMLIMTTAAAAVRAQKATIRSTDDGSSIEFVVPTGGTVLVDDGVKRFPLVSNADDLIAINNSIDTINKDIDAISEGSEVRSKRIRRVEQMLGTMGTDSTTGLTRDIFKKMVAFQALEARSWVAKSVSTAKTTGGGEMVVSGRGFIKSTGNSLYRCRFIYTPTDSEDPVIVHSIESRVAGDELYCKIPAWPREHIKKALFTSAFSVIEGNPGVVVPAIDESEAATSFEWHAHGPRFVIDEDIPVVSCQGGEECSEVVGFDITDEDSDPEQVEVTITKNSDASCFTTKLGASNREIEFFPLKPKCTGKLTLHAVDQAGSNTSITVSVVVDVGGLWGKYNVDAPQPLTIKNGQTVQKQCYRVEGNLNKDDITFRVAGTCPGSNDHLIFLHQTQGEKNSGYQGGIIAIAARKVDIKRGGTINAQGKGFKGGARQCSNSDYTWGQIGEDFYSRWFSRQQTAWNSGTAGGGGNGQGAGGGGGHESRGGGGVGSGCNRGGGTGGYTFKSVALTEQMIFGGGGGAAGAHHSCGRCGTDGGRSGGIIFIFASGDVKVEVANAISARGNNGNNGVQVCQAMGGGGGGSGGSIFIASTAKGNAAVPAANILDIRGGTGGTPSGGGCGPAGRGGDGGSGKQMT